MFLDRYLLRLTHYILEFGTFVYQFMVITWSMAVNFTLHRKRKENHILPDTAWKGDLLKKLPRHIAYIVTETSLSYKDLANLVVWAVEVGIAYISIYDPNGEVKQNNKILEDLIQQKNKSTQNSTQYDICIKSSTDLHDCGKDSNKTYYVALLSLEDGRKSIVRLTQQLSKYVQTGPWSLGDIVPDKVHSLLQENYGFPDPDLILRFGNVSSLVGYLPWHVRLSEILSVPTHHGMDYHIFLSTLMKYGCLQQRFGK